jgi:uncharacterized membrane protein
MGKGRMEAFSDGVIAILITIMVLEMKVPHGTDWAALEPVLPIFLSYVLSYIYLGIYWNNHHHLLHASKHVGGGVLWANLHLLFWLSLVPFVTGWMGENHFGSLPVSMFGVVLLGAALAYTILVRSLIRRHGADSTLARAIGKDRKGWVSLLFYILAVPGAWLSPWFSEALYVAVAIIWLVPDSRIEKALPQAGGQAHSGHETQGGHEA